jgi:uncharacterized protein (TIGR02453 family)
VVGEFRGWTEDFQRFFIGLGIDNSKKYFEAHRKTYEQKVRDPMVALLRSLETEFGPSKVSRPYRDIRFSKDKSPYKTNIYGHSAGGYVSLDAKGLVTGGGHYELSPEALSRYRDAVATDTTGKPLAEIVEGLEGRGYEVGGEELKRVPSPYPQDHPRARLLRHKRLFYWKTLGLQPWLGTPEARDHVAAAWRDGAELDAWFRKQVG